MEHSSDAPSGSREPSGSDGSPEAGGPRASEGDAPASGREAAGSGRGRFPRPRILTRYVLRSHAAPFVFALSALTLIMLLDELGEQFGRLVGKGLHWSVIAEVFGLSIPFIVAMTLPMAVLVATLYAFNRLAAGNEITAVKANGVSLPRLVLPVALVATLIAGWLVWFNNTVLPESNHRLQGLLTSISRKKPSFALRERTINEVLTGQLFLQVASIDRETNTLQDVVLYDERDVNRSRTIYADSGRMAFNEAQTDLYLTLHRGTTQERKADEPDSYQRMRFEEMVMRVPQVTNRLNREAMGSYRGERELPVSRMRREVREARDRGGQLREESRQFAVFVTARLLGREPEDAGRGRGAGARVAPDGGRTGAARGDGPRGFQDAGAEDGSAAASGPADSAAVRQDSILRSIRQEARRAARSSRSLAAMAGRFGSYETRWKGTAERAYRYEVEIQKKYSIPAACIVFVLIGAPIGARYREGGVAMVVGVSLVVFCAYYVSLVGGEELADHLILSPFWAMWTPNVLFGAGGLWALWRAEKVG